MGFSIAWIAIHGKDRDAVVSSFGLHSLGEVTEYPEGVVSGTSLPNGYYLLFLNDCFHSFVTPERLAVLSQDCEIVGCQVEEHIMVSAAFLWKNGTRRWSVVHEAEKGISNLEVIGEPPNSLAALAEAAEKQQSEENESPAFADAKWGVDYFFSVPVQLASSIANYSHDRLYFEWGKPVYEPLTEGVLN